MKKYIIRGSVPKHCKEIFYKGNKRKLLQEEFEIDVVASNWAQALLIGMEDVKGTNVLAFGINGERNLTEKEELDIKGHIVSDRGENID